MPLQCEEHQHWKGFRLYLFGWQHKSLNLSSLSLLVTLVTATVRLNLSLSFQKLQKQKFFALVIH